MATASMSMTSIAVASAKERGNPSQSFYLSKDLNARSKLGCRLTRSCSAEYFSSKDAAFARTELRRSSSYNDLCCVRASATPQPNHNKNALFGIFRFQFPSYLVPHSLRSLLMDPLSKNDQVDLDVQEGGDMWVEKELKRANWVERVIELQSQWRQKQPEDDQGHSPQVGNEDFDECRAEDGCGAEYDDDDDDDDDGDHEINGETFSRLLKPVSLSETKLLSQLAFLSFMAYAIPEIKGKDLRCYGLELLTSSLEKKAEAAAIKDKLDCDSNSLRLETSATGKSTADKKEHSGKKHLPHPFVAYEIAASAASFVQSKAKDLFSLASQPRLGINDESQQDKVKYLQEQEEETPPRVYKSEMAAYVATSTMTAVVAADEKQKQKAARDLRSLRNSPCEWFVCDDPSIYTRFFVIQGSDSLASWQTNLFFEPSEFEGTDALVHRGIYEAAKGIYEQFIPEISQHLERYGSRAKLQFTGHSLGGSLSLLVHLMLLTRKVVEPSSLLPVVTFGSPFVFCGGQKVLNELGLDENHVHSVMMHRDIVPRAFSCNYPNHVAQLLKRLNGTFRSHSCLNKNKMLYSPMGKIFILQPDENSSPGHPFLPPGIGLYALEKTHCAPTASALKAFLNNPHPLETLSDLRAYGCKGTILRDHESSNYLTAVNKVIRQQTREAIRKAREQRRLLWPLLTSQSPHAWSHDRSLKEIMGA